MADARVLKKGSDVENPSGWEQQLEWKEQVWAMLCVCVCVPPHSLQNGFPPLVHTTTHFTILRTLVMNRAIKVMTLGSSRNCQINMTTFSMGTLLLLLLFVLLLSPNTSSTNLPVTSEWVNMSVCLLVSRTERGNRHCRSNWVHNHHHHHHHHHHNTTYRCLNASCSSCCCLVIFFPLIIMDAAGPADTAWWLVVAEWGSGSVPLFIMPVGPRWRESDRATAKSASIVLILIDWSLYFRTIQSSYASYKPVYVDYYSVLRRNAACCCGRDESFTVHSAHFSQWTMALQNDRVNDFNSGTKR